MVTYHDQTKNFKGRPSGSKITRKIDGRKIRVIYASSISATTKGKQVSFNANGRDVTFLHFSTVRLRQRRRHRRRCVDVVVTTSTMTTDCLRRRQTAAVDDISTTTTHRRRRHVIVASSLRRRRYSSRSSVSYTVVVHSLQL